MGGAPRLPRPGSGARAVWRSVHGFRVRGNLSCVVVGSLHLSHGFPRSGRAVFALEAVASAPALLRGGPQLVGQPRAWQSQLFAPPRAQFPLIHQTGRLSSTTSRSGWSLPLFVRYIAGFPVVTAAYGETSTTADNLESRMGSERIRKSPFRQTSYQRTPIACLPTGAGFYPRSIPCK